LQRHVDETTSALFTAKRHFQILLEGVEDHAIFALDVAGNVVNWNSTAQKIMGYTAEEMINCRFEAFYRPEDRRVGEPSRALRAAREKGKHPVEGWRIRKNRTLFFVAGSVSSIRDSDGNLVGFVSVLRDLTERRDAEEKLVQAREQLATAQKMEAIGKLTGGIAHDFNNLLMIIGGNAQIFQRLLDPKLPRAIEAIQTAAKRGETLTRQLLTFSRRQHLSPAVIDLATCIRNLNPMIQSSLRGNIVYNEDIPAGAWLVEVDLAELELALVNIAVNARDAMPNGGTFTLSLSDAFEDDEILDARLDGPLIAIRCSDTGMGIAPDLLSKIFDPYFTTKEVGKGTGLGLSQVHGFAYQARGTVTAQSKMGEGTTIAIYLPWADKDLSLPAVDHQPSQHPTVLIVDDSAEVAEVTSSLFGDLGYSSIYENSADAALQVLAGGTKVDLVFSDIVMPGSMDGIGLAAEIRSRYPGLPVILTTGYSDAAQAVPSNLRILRKPFDSGALKSFIQELARPH
jgi:PAS domain S-box-containing protein